ncbi:MAG: YraN family protein [Burkholderiales bacterium]|jgi:putative endonuclease|nr:YraN family protein [Burkholderiales bacterium]
MTSSKVTGNTAEDLAAEYLISQGLKLVQRNFYSRFGELDLIMRDQDSLVFVEVKHRRSGLNNAIESITPAKQRKMVKTAQFYLLKLGRDVNCRFDAVVFNEWGQVEWLKNIIIL